RSAYGSREGPELFSLAEARARGYTADPQTAQVVRPRQLGIQVLEDYDLEELRGRIDWSPFFTAWEMPGSYPKIFEHARRGEEARRLFDDANRALDEIIANRTLRARGVFGIWPANRSGDDIEVYTDESRREVLTVFHMLRQQKKLSEERARLSLADYLLPRESGTDWIGAFAVTAGIGCEDLVRRYEAAGDDYNAIMVKVLADRLAEAFAERLHERVRKEFWGYAPDEDLSNEELIRSRYRGIRPAHGYPACPDHTEKAILWELLDPTSRAGITLTEHYAMWPPAAVSGLYFAHPESVYFGLGEIGRDQVEDYAARKGMPLGEIESWLAPVLGYDPAAVGAR